MLRYIMRRKWRHGAGDWGESLYTIDGDAKSVETDLRRGGFGEEAYDHTELVGVEILEDPK